MIFEELQKKGFNLTNKQTNKLLINIYPIFMSSYSDKYAVNYLSYLFVLEAKCGVKSLNT